MMAAAHDLEMEDVNMNMGRDIEEELEEEKEMKEDGKAGSVYLLCCVEASETVDHLGHRHLGKSIYLQSYEEGGSLEIYLIHAGTCWSSAHLGESYYAAHFGYSLGNGPQRPPSGAGVPGRSDCRLVFRGQHEINTSGLLVGSLASSIFDPLKYLVGASGGVYALMGGYFMNVLVNFREMIPAFGIVRLLIIILIIVSDVGFALYRRFFVPANGSPVSFAAHIAGGFAGMSIGYTVFSCFDKALLRDPRFWAAIAAYLACVLFAVLFNIFLSPAN
ncbi:rhomboid-related protein 2 isoform X1 [Pteropus medius]|nr:rhomboid-related protein 2 isoform X1 [Pteropus giganteus]